VGEALKSVWRAGFALIQIGAELHGSLFVAVEQRGSKHGHPRPLLEIAHPFQDFEAVTARHLQVEHHHVGKRMRGAIGELACSAEVADGRITVCRPGDDLKFGVTFQRALEEQNVVLGIFN